MPNSRRARLFERHGQEKKHAINWIVVILILVAGVCGCATTPRAPVGRSQGEKTPVFGVSHVLPEEILQGSNYRLAERVPVQEYQYVFTIRSDFGTITTPRRENR